MMCRNLANKNGRKLKVFQTLSSQLKPADVSGNLQRVSYVIRVLLLYFITTLCDYFLLCEYVCAQWKKQMGKKNLRLKESLLLSCSCCLNS